MSKALIQALQNQALYDHEVTHFQLLETHISWVILTGPFAYKIKKPMNFGFLDFSTLAARARFCEAEVQLNQRLAPELYLGVVPIYGDEQQPRFEANGEPFEYAVKMVQFDQADLLDHKLAQGELSSAHIEALADQVAGFHQRIEQVPHEERFGEPDQVYAPMQQNFEQILPFLQDQADIMQLQQLQAWAESTFERLRPVLEQRKLLGFIRATHGDIHLGNVTLYQGKVTLFDCIEFNDDFRFTDVISDSAFMVMDLESRDLHSLARRFLNRYIEHTGDYEGLEILGFYKSYRAMVRAKIALFSIAPDADASAREAGFAQYRRYANLAESYTFVPQRFVLALHGYSGSGKTTVGNAMIDALPAIRIKTDVERKRLFNLPALADSKSALDQGLYTPENTAQVYQRMADLTDELLHLGYGVIVDGTNLKQANRVLFEQRAEEVGAPSLLISCEAPLDTIRSWIQARADAGDDASEATLEVLEHQLQRAEPLTEEERQHALIVHTDQPGEVETLIRNIQQRLA